MLRVGQLWRPSDLIADVKAANERAPDVGVWGEGLVDRSLASLWYQADWSEVGDDELVFLLPTLSTWRPGRTEAPAPSSDSPVRYLTRMLMARAASAAALIAANATRDAATRPARALELLVTRAILTAIPLEALTTTVPASCRAPRLPAAASAEAPDAGAQSLPDWLALEFTALAHLDRMLLDARGAASATDASPLVDWPLSLADVVLATINARLNGVYVHPEFAHAHELFSAAALLGHLACGRAAYLPPHIAQSLVDLLSGDSTSAAGGDDWCAPIVRTYAALAGGADRVLWLAQRAAAAGRPLLVRPRAPVAPSDTGRTTWNARLLQRVCRRWHGSA